MDYKNNLPEWAEKLSDGNYMELGAQLCTRDGRKIGNAYVDNIIYGTPTCGSYVFSNPSYVQFAIIYTDAGTCLCFSERELREYFYEPKYVMKLDDARRKFRRKQKDA